MDGYTGRYATTFELRLEASVRLRVNAYVEETGLEAFCIAASKAIEKKDIGLLALDGALPIGAYVGLDL